MMQKSMMGKWIALLLAAMILLAACGPAQTSSAQPVSSAAAQSGAAIEKGEGQTAFTLQVSARTDSRRISRFTPTKKRWARRC